MLRASIRLPPDLATLAESRNGGFAAGALLRYPVAMALVAAPMLSLAFWGCGGMSHPGIVRGHELYDTCVPCHGRHGAGNQELGAPAITGMEAMGAPGLLNQPDWYVVRQLDKFKSGMRGADSTDAQGQQMAAMSSTLEDHQAMLDVIAYIRTLKK